MALDSAQETSLNQNGATRSPAVERMRLHRQRRRLGLRCLVVELRETEIDELIRRRLLIRRASHSFLDQTLTPNRWSA